MVEVGDHPARALEPEEERLDAGLELAAVDRLGDDVVGARLEEPDPFLDVVDLGQAHHRDRRQARRRPDLAADVRRGSPRAGDVDDHEAVVGGAGNGLGRILDDDDGIADAGQHGIDRLGGDGVGFEQEDGARGHVVSG